MKITVTGSLGNISKVLTEKLVAAGHIVTVISSNDQKREVIKALGAVPAIGSVEDVEFLTGAFHGADAIYTMVPPSFPAENWKQYIAGIGRNYALAIAKAGVKHVVNLSSIGAHLAEGAGPVSGIYHVEQQLNALENVNVLHLRPGYFYNNFYNSAGMIKELGIMGSNNPGSTVMVLVDPADIAQVAAQALQSLDFSGKSFRYIASDIRSSAEVATILGTAVGKPELPWVEFSDEQLKEGMLRNGLTEEVANNYVEMGVAVRTGKLFEDFSGKANGTKLEEFAKRFSN